MKNPKRDYSTRTTRNTRGWWDRLHCRSNRPPRVGAAVELPPQPPGGIVTTFASAKRKRADPTGRRPTTPGFPVRHRLNARGVQYVDGRGVQVGIRRHVELRRQRLAEVGQNDAQVRRADLAVIVKISGGPNAGLAEVGQNNAQVRRAHGPVQIGVAIDGGLDRDGSRAAGCPESTQPSPTSVCESSRTLGRWQTRWRSWPPNCPESIGLERLDRCADRIVSGSVIEDEFSGLNIDTAVAGVQHGGAGRRGQFERAALDGGQAGVVIGRSEGQRACAGLDEAAATRHKAADGAGGQGVVGNDARSATHGDARRDIAGVAQRSAGQRECHAVDGSGVHIKRPPERLSACVPVMPPAAVTLATPPDWLNTPGLTEMPMTNAPATSSSPVPVRV